MSRNLGIIVAVIGAALGLVSAAHASTVILTPVSASAGGGLGGGTYAGSGTELINGDGLAFAVPATFNTIADLPKHDEDVFHMWEANATDTGWVVFNLGSVKSFNTIIVWNDGEEAHANGVAGPIADLSGRSVKNLTIYTDNSAITPTGSGPFTGNGANVVDTSSFSSQFSQATNATLPSTNVADPAGGAWNLDYNIVPVVYTLPSYVTAQYVEFNIASSWTGPAGSYVGLSEVRFGATPEPASLGLLVIGGAVLLGKRRRRVA